MGLVNEPTAFRVKVTICIRSTDFHRLNLIFTDLVLSLFEPKANGQLQKANLSPLRIFPL